MLAPVNSDVMCNRKIYFLSTLMFISLAEADDIDVACDKRGMQLSNLDSELIIVKEIDLGPEPPEQAFEIWFPETYSGRKFSQARIFFGELENGKLENMLLMVPTLVFLESEHYTTTIASSVSLDGGIYANASYGECVVLGKVVKPHNKSLNEDTSEPGAG